MTAPSNNALGFEWVTDNLLQAHLPVVALDLSARQLTDAVRTVQKHLSLLLFQALVLALKEEWPADIEGVRISHLPVIGSTSSGLNLKVTFPEHTPFAVWSAAEKALHQRMEPFFKDSDTYFQHLVSMAFSNRVVGQEDLDGLLDAALVGDPRLSHVRAARLGLQLDASATGSRPLRF